METVLKKIKYRVLVPFLIYLRTTFLGDKRKNREELNPKTKMFFIMGSGRNGSTLLAMLLNRHDEIFLPPEQYALPYSIISWHLKVFQSWKVFCTESVRNYAQLNQNWQLLPSHYSSLENEISAVDNQFQKPSNLFYSVLNSYSEQSGKRAQFLGDHSPITSLFYKHIQREFPTSKYIFLVRHPLDVVLSYSKLKDNPASDAVYACWKWNNSISAYKWMKKKRLADVMLIKYEDLVSEPQVQTQLALSFLGAASQDIVNESSENHGVKSIGGDGYAHHENLSKPITIASIGGWKKSMDAKAIEKLRPLLETNAKEFGYSLIIND